MSRDPAREGVRLAQAGLLVNAALAAVKLVTGVLGHSYALVADGIESGADIVGSLVVLGGLRVASRRADASFPFGYGKAEALAAAGVSLLLLGAALAIAIQAVREIRTPHHAPAPYTLVVLVAVVAVKEALYRRTRRAADASGSSAVFADAWHHRSDAITSLAAFVGIAVALAGGPGWESADDWAALLAAGVIAVNGSAVLRRGIDDLMDRAPPPDLVARVRLEAEAVAGVRATEKCLVRKVGSVLYVDLHVQADPAMSLHDAHALSGAVKARIRAALPAVAGVLIHMEPHEAAAA